MEINDSSKLKKLYQIEERKFLERLRRYERMSHTMDMHQFYLEGILLRREEVFYKYLPVRESSEHMEESSIGFDYEFIHKDVGGVGWVGRESESSNGSSSGGLSMASGLSSTGSRREKKEEGARQKPVAREQRTKGARLYVCEIEGCDKKYTSSFGLKYHMKEGHSQEKMNVFKPFGCPFEGCGKKYKNSNGLKYHIRHYHDSRQPPN